MKVVETLQGREVIVGPDSVGHYITRDAKVFGGDALTTTDVVVASGRAELGMKENVADVEPEVIEKASKAMKKQLEGIIDKYASLSVPLRFAHHRPG